MRKEHTPFFLLKLRWKIKHWYIQRYIAPQFSALGAKPEIAKPHTLSIFGDNISAGHHLHLVSDKTNPIKLTTLQGRNLNGKIRFGDYCLVAPGVTLNSANSIILGDSCMLASEVIISDSDWHGKYNRVRPFKCNGDVELKENVWVGTRSIICKGVTIGKNSIVGAGSVVTHDIPENVIAAGNPAKVVGELDEKKRMISREFLFNPEVRLSASPKDYEKNQNELDEYMFAENSIYNWLRVLIKPNRHD